MIADPEEMDALVRDAWLPIFQMYQSRDQPSWEDFEREFGRYFGECCEMHLGSLTADELMNQLWVRHVT